VAYVAGVGSADSRSKAMSPGAPQTSKWVERALAAVDRNWRWALAVLLIADAVLLLYMGRGLTFFYDDWDFVTHDYGGGIHSLLVAHVGNISLFPIAIYKVLFHLVGLNHYGIFRLVVVVLHLLAAVLIFVLASRRIPRVPALLAMALILFLGAVWEDLLWAFQIGYLLSVVGGLGAWVLLERRDRLGDLGAMACLVVAVGSSSLGIPLIIGVAVELAWQRDWKRLWVVAIPTLLYIIWYLHYGESEVTLNSLINTPGFAADLAAAAAGGLVGRALEWGRPLAVLGLVVLLRQLSRPVPVSARMVGLIATGVSLWVVTAAARSTISAPETSRYIYLGAVVIVLGGVELLRGLTITPRVTALAAVLVAGCAVTGLTVLDTGAKSLRSTSKTVTAELGALELAAAHAPAGYQPDPQRAPQIVAGPYLHTVRAIGSSPADSPAAIAAADPVSRAAADGVLLALDAPKLQPPGSTQSSVLGPAPAVSALSGGTQSRRIGCVQLTPLPAASLVAKLTVPARGVIIHNDGAGPALLAMKRFGEAFDPLPASAPPHSDSRLLPPSDAAVAPWQLQVTSTSRLSICAISVS
jgi:hypothetical protein